MTEEQIRQNAANYYEHIINDDAQYRFACNCFVAGAHSRDKEVNDLENALANVNELCHQQRNKIYELRHPWISVDDRLLDIGQKVITITNKGKMLLVARTTQSPHKEEGGWRWEHYIGKVTHWMPIPELKGE